MPREILNDAPTERVEAVLRARLSYSDIARQCGLTGRYIQQIFGGVRLLSSLARANRIASYLGVTMDELYEALLHREGKRPAWIERRERNRRLGLL